MLFVCLFLLSHIQGCDDDDDFICFGGEAVGVREIESRKERKKERESEEKKQIAFQAYFLNVYLNKN